MVNTVQTTAQHKALQVAFYILQKVLYTGLDKN